MADDSPTERQVIDPELAAFIGGPVMIVFGASDAAGRPALGRALGVRRREDGDLDLFVSRAQWGAVTAALETGASLAVTFSRPTDYRTFQVKGVLASIAPADAADASAAREYREAVAGSLRDLGVLQPQLEQWLVCEDLITLRLTPSAVFAQTPGPGAGARLGGVP